MKKKKQSPQLLWQSLTITGSNECSTTGTPTEDNWPGISSIDEFKSQKFPKYKPQALINHAPRWDGRPPFCAEYDFILAQTCCKYCCASHKPSFNNGRWKWANVSSQAGRRAAPVFGLVGWKAFVWVCLVRSVCSVSLPARKSCGIVDCFLPPHWPASLHVAPTSADLPFFCCPPLPSLPLQVGQWWHWTVDVLPKSEYR